MNAANLFLVLGLVVLCSCGRKEAGSEPEFQVRTDTGVEVSADMKKQFAEMARLQAEGLARATTVIHSAYNYSGFSQIRPVAGGKLVAVDVEFRGYGDGFDPDDVEVLDGSVERSFGSDPDIAYLTSDGKFKSYDYVAPVADEPLRYLFVYAVPSQTESIRLAYWGKIIATNPVSLRAAGLSLRVRDTAIK